MESLVFTQISEELLPRDAVFLFFCHFWSVNKKFVSFTPHRIYEFNLSVFKTRETSNQLKLITHIH